MKKLVSILMLFVFVVVAIPISAADIEPLFTGDGSIQGQISRGSGSFTALARTDYDVEKIVVSGVLYEDGWLWDTQVGTCSNSSSGRVCTAIGSYSFKDSKKYRLECTATFYYTNGTSETVTGSTTG